MLMPKQMALFATAALACVASSSRAGAVTQQPAAPAGPVIKHEPVIACVVAGQHPLFRACITPGGADLKQFRFYFRGEGAASWFYTLMKRKENLIGESCYEGIGLKPKKNSIKSMDFYFEALDSRTQDYTARVAQSKSECDKDKLAAAPFSSSGPGTVFGAGGAGFGGGSILLPVAGGVVLAGGATTLAITSGNDGGGPGGGTSTGTSTTTTVTTTTTTTTTTTSTSTTTTTNQPNRPPTITCLSRPDPPFIKPGESVTLRTCGSRDPDGDPLVFEYTWGDGFRDGGSCEATHTYTTEGDYNAQACVNDRQPDHKRCCDYRVMVHPDPPGCTDTTKPTTAITAPTPGFSPPPVYVGDPTTITASASDNVGVTSVSFFATPADFSGNPAGAAYVIGTDATAPYSITYNFSIACTSYNYLVSSQASDACGNVGTSAPVWIVASGCGSAPVEIFSINWASQLDAAGAAGRISLNDVLLGAGEGRQQGTARARRGENRLDGELMAADGKPGLWRFELGTPIDPGSLRILAGEAVQLTDTFVIFRVAGNPGEKVSFSFRRR